MASKAKVTTKDYLYGEDYGEGPQITSQSIVFEHGEFERSYSVGEGEPEDMTFGRDLDYVDSIEGMIRHAHKLGKEGVEIEYNSIEEKD